MLFNSYIFVFVFLPAVLLLWYGPNRLGRPRAAQLALAGMSLWFYGYGHAEYTALILASVLVNYAVSCAVGAAERRAPGKRALRAVIGTAGIVFNLGLLFYFKYYDFFIRNMNRLTGAGWQLKNIALPLGISFFTFQQISFLADRMTGEAEGCSFLDYLNYVTFFPQLVAGPIVNHRDLVPQFTRVGQGRMRGTPETFEKGISLFIAGMAKKVLLADKLGAVVDYGYADIASLDGPGAFLVMLAYTFQIYLDFSGYCDMAVGLGWMLQIELPRNFDSPYRSLSVREFWRRWHMTLNAFFTRYVYIPLGGSRRGFLRRLLNTMLVFLLSGIWHGAAWTFVVWGLLHGAMLCIEQICSEKLPERVKAWGRSAAGRALRWCYTFSFVNLAWVLFRSGSFSEALLFYRRLFSFSHTGKIWELGRCMQASWNHVAEMALHADGVKNLFYLGVLGVFLLLAALLSGRRNLYEWVAEERRPVWRMWLLAALFAVCVVSFSGVTTFLYFNF